MGKEKLLKIHAAAAMAGDARKDSESLLSISQLALTMATAFGLAEKVKPVNTDLPETYM